MRNCQGCEGQGDTCLSLWSPDALGALSRERAAPPGHLDLGLFGYAQNLIGLALSQQPQYLVATIFLASPFCLGHCLC